MSKCVMDSFAVPTSVRTADILVIDSQSASLAGLLPALKQQFPESVVYPAKTRRAAEAFMAHQSQWMLVIADLMLPPTPGALPSLHDGFQVLNTLFASSPQSNLLVLSDDLKPLTQMKSKIAVHGGGFATAHKQQPWPEIVEMAKLAMSGMTCWSRFLHQIGVGQEIPLNWLEVVELKFQKGLNDKAIAQRMHVSDRTVRNYWLRLQGHLDIADDPSHDVRVQILLKLKELGLLV